ncbi:MAG: hypothetical protein IIC67_05110 [Thaumarchaeota archaeon]|nr:hypothetical protein [Nitrososphaerota archaeon]
MVDWETVKLPKQMAERLTEFVTTNYAKNSGFTSKSQIVVFAVREFLSNYSKYLAYLDYVGFENKIVKIMDHETGSIVSVKLDKEKGELICKKHNSDSCDHIRFLWTLPRFREDLKKFKDPHMIGAKIKTWNHDDIHVGLTKLIKSSTYRPNTGVITNEKLIKILQRITKDLKKKK